MRGPNDALIVGSGPAGIRAADTLARAGATVCVIGNSSSGCSLAAESLSPETCQELSALGVNSELSPTVAVPCYGIDAEWGEGRLTALSYLLNPFGHAVVVDRLRFHTCLLGVARKADVHIIHPARFRYANNGGGHWEIGFECDGRTGSVHGTVAIDATGRSAVLARSQGARRQRYDQLFAMSAVLDVALTEQLLFVATAAYGWWYAAPVPNGTLLGLVSDVDVIRNRRAADPGVWLELLRKMPFIADRLRSFPNRVRLSGQSCETAFLALSTGCNWLAAGDAEYTVDPLSSRGVLKALQSGNEAGQVALQYLAGRPGVLRQYAQSHRDQFEVYLQQKQRQYALEERWRAEPFWARRCQAAHSNHG